MEKKPESRMQSCESEFRSTQTSTSGGSSETEAKEFAVRPHGLSSPGLIEPTTTTPVTKWPIRRRNSNGSIDILLQIDTPPDATPPAAPQRATPGIARGVHCEKPRYLLTW